MTASLLSSALAERSYPGRGCLAARTTDGDRCLVYFVTGRSAASQDRSMRIAPNGDVAVVGLSGSGDSDSLRHYVAVVKRDNWIVLGNGSQVESIAEGLATNGEVMSLWSEHSFEPDDPIFTPRIWLATRVATDGFGCLIGYVLRSQRGDGRADRIAWLVEQIPAGSGILMTTYDGSIGNVHVNPHPVDVRVEGRDAQEILEEVWINLSPNLRVASCSVRPDTFPHDLLIIR